MLKVHWHIDDGVIRRAKERMHDCANKAHVHKVSTGIHIAEGTDPKVSYKREQTALSLIQDAVIHEFGAGNVPDRSFIRTWFDSNLARLKREAIAAMRAEYKGSAGAVKDQAADWGAELSAWLTSGEVGWTPLAESTKKQRVSAGLEPDPPLFATGQLAKALRAMMDGEYVY